jgi:hypothetical protein
MPVCSPLTAKAPKQLRLGLEAVRALWGWVVQVLGGTGSGEFGSAGVGPDNGRMVVGMVSRMAGACSWSALVASSIVAVGGYDMAVVQEPVRHANGRGVLG